jgi:arylsulfatase A-like enzyme
MLSPDDMPHISGVHGVLKAMARESEPAAPPETARLGSDPHPEPEFFPEEEMRRLHAQQVRCVEYVDGLIGRLYDRCPRNTHLIVTSDHGELFGEGGYFGHGPIMHEKCFEVPFVEGTRP